MLKLLLPVLFSTLIFSPIAHADLAWQPAPASSEVGFKAVGRPAMLKINGEKGKLTGQIVLRGGALHGQLDVAMNDFTTGIDLRDRHMKETYLETGKFPNARLIFDGTTIPGIQEQGNFKVESAPFRASLELHGQRKPIEGEASISRSGAVAQVDAKFKVKLSDYGIQIPKYLGITVAEDVTIEIKASGPLRAIAASAPVTAKPVSPKRAAPAKKSSGR